MAVVPLLAGDVNQDGNVALDDFALLQECLAGPGMMTVGEECRDADIDNDNDVDLGDLAGLQASFTGSGVEP